MNNDSTTKILTCIICPNSCRISLTYDPDTQEITSIHGALCKKGKDWVEQELFKPMRTLCSSIRITGGREPLASIRTTKAVSLSSIKELMELIKASSIKAPVEIGQVVLSEPLGLDCDVIITRGVDRL